MFFTKLRGGVITPSGRSTELADVGRKKVVEDGVIADMRGTKTSADIGRCDGNWTKVVVRVVVVRDEGSVTWVLIGDVASVTTGLIWSRKHGCGHGGRAKGKT